MTHPGQVLQSQPTDPRTAAGAITLAELETGQRGIVVGFAEQDQTLKRRLIAFGVVRGTEIMLNHKGPLGNPRAYSLLGYRLSLRNEDARGILLRVEAPPRPVSSRHRGGPIGGSRDGA